MNDAGSLSLGLVLDHFTPTRGGAERYLSVLMQELALRGHDCQVYCCTGVECPGVRLVHVPLRKRTRSGREREFAARAVGAAREAGRVVYAIRHVQEADLYQPHGGSWAETTRARRQLHWLPAAHRWWRQVHPRYRYLAQSDEAVFRNHPGLLTVAVSDLVRQDLLARYGAHQPRVEVVWPWVDAAGPVPVRAALTEGPRLGFLAHEFTLKGLDVLLAALAQEQLRDATLRVAGREAPGRWRRRARRLGVSDRVEFVGEIAEVRAFFRGVDVLVHPTRHDPCALVCLEALAHGVAVVTTRWNGAAPLVERAGGLVLEACEPASLAEAVARCDRAPDRAAHRQQVVADLTREAHVSRMEDLLREAARERPS